MACPLACLSFVFCRQGKARQLLYSHVLPVSQPVSTPGPRPPTGRFVLRAGPPPGLGAPSCCAAGRRGGWARRRRARFEHVVSDEHAAERYDEDESSLAGAVRPTAARKWRRRRRARSENVMPTSTRLACTARTTRAVWLGRARPWRRGNGAGRILVHASANPGQEQDSGQGQEQGQEQGRGLFLGDAVRHGAARADGAGGAQGLPWEMRYGTEPHELMAQEEHRGCFWEMRYGTEPEG
ncbi:hypothetical protein B0T24DRAFT_692789 [Lasiosphaeria ovina]|uniref:Uncharacterized protein n=1 Tax=Lasiosphaeria ovina TaxID=92902 RepID=A0AAE0MXL9_9PEZI|nr:hypothetical protein B0T24DRAFT_692789 [Lasiosphaeria ovina]